MKAWRKQPMIKIREIKAHDRANIYDLMQQGDKIKSEELEATLHQIDLSLFDVDQRLFKVVIAENESTDLLGYAVYGPDPRAAKTYQVYNLVYSPTIKNGEVLHHILKYIENELARIKGRIISIEISSHLRFKKQYDTYLEHNYNVTSRLSNFYSIGEDKLILIKNIAP